MEKPKGLRKRNHDYCAPWKYHITISKTSTCEYFSKLRIDKLTPDSISLKYSPLGIIISQAIRNLQSSTIRIYQYCIMPDHIHLLLHVKQRLPRHLGFELAALKTEVTTEWRRLKITINCKSSKPDITIE